MMNGGGFTFPEEIPDWEGGDLMEKMEIGGSAAAVIKRGRGDQGQRMTQQQRKEQLEIFAQQALQREAEAEERSKSQSSTEQGRKELLETLAQKCVENKPKPQATPKDEKVVRGKPKGDQPQ